MNKDNGVVYLGSCYGDRFHDGFDYAVYDQKGIAPTLVSSHVGGWCVHSPRLLGYTHKHESGCVYDSNEIAQTITAGTHGYGMGYILVDDGKDLYKTGNE